jgi:flagellum-specific peptidoglycan hydrolase FlgJ
MEKLPIGSRVEWTLPPKKSQFGPFFWLGCIFAALLLLLPKNEEEAPERAEMGIIQSFPESYLETMPDAPDHIRKYILRFQKVAIAEQEKYGIPASIKMAQGILESGAGTSRLTRGSNNHFGVKCHRPACKHQNCVNACDDSCDDYFRKYETAWLSWREHSLILADEGKRYAKYKTKCDDYKCWANGLQKSGYATSRTYAKKLIGIIETYDLHKLDKGATFAP